MNKYGKIDSHIDAALAYIIVKTGSANQKVLHHDFV